MLAELNSIMPGAHHWPTFEDNLSQAYEARLVMVNVTDSPSIFLRDFDGARLPLVLSHPQGEAVFNHQSILNQVQVACSYADPLAIAKDKNPLNPLVSP